MRNTTAKILTHPQFDRPAVVNPKLRSSTRKIVHGCFNFRVYRANKLLDTAVQQRQELEKVPYVMTLEDELKVLKAMATGSIQRLEERMRELGMEQSGAR